MAITTVDGIIAGAKPLSYVTKALSGTVVAGRPFSTYFFAGIPGAATVPTPGLSGAALTSGDGQIPVPAASNNTYITRLSGLSTAQNGTLYLCDRLWHNSGLSVTSTASQTINSVAWPARDIDASTNGRGVYIGLELSTSSGTGAPTLTMTYTNSAGTGSRTANPTYNVTGTSIAGSFYPMGLAAGDVGVRSIQSFQLSATWTSGVAHLVAYRVIAAVELCGGAGVPDAVDALSGGFARLWDNSVPFFIFYPETTTTTRIMGTVCYAQG